MPSSSNPFSQVGIRGTREFAPLWQFCFQGWGEGQIWKVRQI
ncbi:MAG: hypothetical protein V7L20_11955 [Nostoc sp.]